MANAGLRHTILPCQIFHPPPDRPYLPDITFRQDSVAVLLAFGTTPVPSPVIPVFDCRAPCKIPDEVVSRVAIQMPAHKAMRGGARAVCFENQPVNHKAALSSILAETHAPMPTRGRGWSYSFPCDRSDSAAHPWVSRSNVARDTPYRAVVRYLVEPFISDHWEENFSCCIGVDLQGRIQSAIPVTP